MPVHYSPNTPGKKISTTALLLISLLSATPVLAIVNVENIRVKEPEEGFSGNLALGMDLESGNTNRSRVALGARAMEAGRCARLPGIQLRLRPQWYCDRRKQELSPWPSCRHHVSKLGMGSVRTGSAG